MNLDYLNNNKKKVSRTKSEHYSYLFQHNLKNKKHSKHFLLFFFGKKNYHYIRRGKKAIIMFIIKKCEKKTKRLFFLKIIYLKYNCN
jgi:hypothetical protein